MNEKTPDRARHDTENALHVNASERLVHNEARSILPSTSSVVQAGAFGAALGGVTTGVQEIARVQRGEITTGEAVERVVKSSAQGAATMAVASVAAQVVRSHPVFGFIALAAAGIGAFVLLSGARETPAGETEAEPGEAEAKPAKA